MTECLRHWTWSLPDHVENRVILTSRAGTERHPDVTCTTSTALVAPLFPPSSSTLALFPCNILFQVKQAAGVEMTRQEAEAQAWKEVSRLIFGECPAQSQPYLKWHIHIVVVCCYCCRLGVLFTSTNNEGANHWKRNLPWQQQDTQYIAHILNKRFSSPTCPPAMTKYLPQSLNIIQRKEVFGQYLSRWLPVLSSSFRHGCSFLNRRSRRE